MKRVPHARGTVAREVGLWVATFAASCAGGAVLAVCYLIGRRS